MLLLHLFLGVSAEGFFRKAIACLREARLSDDPRSYDIFRSLYRHVSINGDVNTSMCIDSRRRQMRQWWDIRSCCRSGKGKHRVCVVVAYSILSFFIFKPQLYNIIIIIPGESLMARSCGGTRRVICSQCQSIHPVSDCLSSSSFLPCCSYEDGVCNDW